MGAEGTAPAIPLLEGGYLELLLSKVEGQGETGRPGAHDGDVFVLGRDDVCLWLAVFRVAQDSGFHVAEGDRLVSEHCALAAFPAGLVAEHSHDPGEHCGVAQELVSWSPASSSRLAQERADVHVKRTRVHTGRRVPSEALRGERGGVFKLHKAISRSAEPREAWAPPSPPAGGISMMLAAPAKPLWPMPSLSARVTTSLLQWVGFDFLNSSSKSLPRKYLGGSGLRRAAWLPSPP